MALFQVNDPDDIVFDTAGGVQAEQAAREAVASEVDIVVGPLIYRFVRKARPILAASAIPVLALSNNIESASPGNWVLGYLPGWRRLTIFWAMRSVKIKPGWRYWLQKMLQRVLSHSVSRLSQLACNRFRPAC